MRVIGLTFFLLFSFLVQAQQVIKGVVADSLTGQPLSFATVRAVRENKAVIAGINGRFSISVKEAGPIQVSYSGHRSKQLSLFELQANDTVFLAPLLSVLQEVIIQPQSDKIRRIVNAAVAAKAVNNPDRYAQYACNVYYKMKVDVETYDAHKRDSFRRREDSLFALRATNRKDKDTATFDTSRRIHFASPSHLFLTETYSRRSYKHPGQVQELVLASRVSGLSKTYFANVITDVLPFHVYTDYIPLNGMDFINPVAKGWQGRYRFALEDEIVSGEDTVFILRYAPKKGTGFNALTGLVYISSRGFAITHFTGSNAVGDSIPKRFARFEQIYTFVDGRWFPQELNYNFGIRDFPEPYTQLYWNGHSRIDSVRFNPSSLQIDKAHPLKFSNSVDLHTKEDWNRYRGDSLSVSERNTYRNLDSIVKASHVDAFILGGLHAATGRVPFGKFDVDLQRIVASNEYEGTRLGLGLYTNNKVSKYYSVGGWWGYGFKDKAAKYGTSFTVFPKGDKENFLSFSYQKNIRLTGEVALHPDLSASLLRNWLLQVVDEFTEYAISGNAKLGYWDVYPSVSQQRIGPLHYAFISGSKSVSNLTANEATIGVRYAYGEKRVPFFDYYLPSGTKYPIIYASLSFGRVSSEAYEANYRRELVAVTFNKHINRWGADQYQLEAGMIRTADDKPLPRSLLMAGKGYRREGINFYTWGGFYTMRPFQSYSDRYVSFLYKHDFDKALWNFKWSKPYLSLAHNMTYGGLRKPSLDANTGVQSYKNGYHESGLLFNRILKYNLGFADVNVNAGPFYHWQKQGSWKNNSVWVIGLSANF